MKRYANERNECMIFTRVMGYYRPVTSFNIGKAQEFKERVWFNTQKFNDAHTEKNAR